MAGFFKTAERDAWLEARRTGIGASDSPAILGLSPWKSAFQVWAEKRGDVDSEELDGNEPAEFGIRLEEPIAMAYADRSGRKVTMWPREKITRHGEYNWLTCTPDATQHDEIRGDGLVQVKTTSAFKASDWSDGPPLMYLVQCQQEMAVMNYGWSTLVVLIGGQKLRYFDIDRNQAFIDALIPKLQNFWELVQSGESPDVDSSMATAKILARLHPDDSGETIILPQEAADWTETIASCESQIKSLEEMVTGAKNNLKAALGDATFGVLPDGSMWSWKTQSVSGYVVKPRTQRVLRKVKTR